MPTPRTAGVKTSTGAKTSSGPTTNKEQPPKTSDSGAAPGPDGTNEPAFKTPKMDDLKPKEKELAESIAMLYAFVGTNIAGMMEQANPPLHHMGRAMGNLSEDIAVQWVVLARTNITVRKWLEKMQNAARGGGLLGLHLMLLAPVAVASGAVPKPLLVPMALLAGVATGDMPKEAAGL